jgi:hypothetical protein
MVSNQRPLIRFANPRKVRSITLRSAFCQVPMVHHKVLPDLSAHPVIRDSDLLHYFPVGLADEVAGPYAADNENLHRRSAVHPRRGAVVRDRDAKSK